MKLTFPKCFISYQTSRFRILFGIVSQNGCAVGYAPYQEQNANDKKDVYGDEGTEALLAEQDERRLWSEAGSLAAVGTGMLIF